MMAPRAGAGGTGGRRRGGGARVDRRVRGSVDADRDDGSAEPEVEAFDPDVVDLPSMPETATRVSQQTAPCRLCGHVVWSFDGSDAHPCCTYWEDEIRSTGRCPACSASAGLNNERLRKRNRQPVPWGRCLPGYPLPKEG